MRGFVNSAWRRLSAATLSLGLVLLMVLAFPGFTSAATPWNLNGNYEIAFTCTSGCSGTFTHEATVSGQNSSGNFNISGGYPVSGPPYDFAWSGTGNVSASAVTMSVDYTLGAPNTHMNMAGTVASNGTMSGTWTDNYPNGTGSRSGTWTTTSGKASTTNKKVVTAANQQGWAFNPDPTNTTPYNFTEDKSSIGNGSLFVQPIGSNPLKKFIATKALGTPVSEFESVSYDFLIAGNGDASDANQFYLNVYANLPSSSTFFDCRYDYVPTTGSTSAFTTASFNATDTPTSVSDRPDAFTCPATLSGMPAGSTISAVVLNVGDTSASDVGLAGYLDNVVINTGNTATTYDFELVNSPNNKNQCKNGGWQNFTDENGTPFTNQGHCVAFVNSNRNVTRINNNNNINITNNNHQSASTGNANSNNNTTGGNATSGAASNSNSTTNNVTVSNNPTF